MTRSKQSGFSLLGMLFWGGIIAVVMVVGAQVVPSVIEYMAISKAAKKAAIQGGSVAEVRGLFDKAAQIDDIKSIRGSDLEVGKEGDRVVVSFAYTREFPLAGPAYLVLKYTGRSK